MRNDDLALYLTLSPEFGGTRFGPFEGLEVRLGADRERCNIVLPEEFGVAREHCKVIRQGDSLILAASERTAAVFVWKGDARRPTQIQAPTAVRPGDSFALVSAEGARFTVEFAPLPPEILAKRKRPKSGRAGLTGERLAAEGWRMAMARLWTAGPVAMLAQGWYMITSGAIFQPRILITLVITTFGYIAALGGSCTALKFKADAVSIEDELEECQQTNSFNADLKSKGIENADFSQLASSVASSPVLGTALAGDDGMRNLVEAAAKEMLGEDRIAYEWLYRAGDPAAEEWVRWRAAVEKAEDLDEVTRYVLPYAAAVRKRTALQWNASSDSLGERACLRGPARLTYRQAKALGLETVQVDAFKSGDVVGLQNDDLGRGELLKEAMKRAEEVPFETAPASGLAQLATSQEACIYAEGDDDRENSSRVLAALRRELGADDPHVPDPSKNAAALNRIVKLFAADSPGNRYGAGSTPLLDLRNGYGSALKDAPTGEAIRKKAAEVIARSIVLPCLGALERQKEAAALFGKSPEPLACLVLNYRLTNKASQ